MEESLKKKYIDNLLSEYVESLGFIGIDMHYLLHFTRGLSSFEIIKVSGLSNQIVELLSQAISSMKEVIEGRAIARYFFMFKFPENYAPGCKQMEQIVQMINAFQDYCNSDDGEMHFFENCKELQMGHLEVIAVLGFDDDVV